MFVDGRRGSMPNSRGVECRGSILETTAIGRSMARAHLTPTELLNLSHAITNIQLLRSLSTYHRGGISVFSHRTAAVRRNIKKVPTVRLG